VDYLRHLVYQSHDLPCPCCQGGLGVGLRAYEGKIKHRRRVHDMAEANAHATRSASLVTSKALVESVASLRQVTSPHLPTPGPRPDVKLQSTRLRKATALYAGLVLQLGQAYRGLPDSDLIMFESVHYLLLRTALAVLREDQPQRVFRSQALQVEEEVCRLFRTDSFNHAARRRRQREVDQAFGDLLNATLITDSIRAGETSVLPPGSNARAMGLATGTQGVARQGAKVLVESEALPDLVRSGGLRTHKGIRVLQAQIRLRAQTATSPAYMRTLRHKEEWRRGGTASAPLSSMVGGLAAVREGRSPLLSLLLPSPYLRVKALLLSTPRS
jgi:hypothetical protein